MLLCGLALILQGRRGYEKFSIRVEQVTQKNQMRTNEENHGAKTNEKRPATTSALAVVDDHPDALQRRTTNNPVAARTVFTSQIWDLYWKNSSIAHDARPKSAQNMRTS